MYNYFFIILHIFQIYLVLIVSLALLMYKISSLKKTLSLLIFMVLYSEVDNSNIWNPWSSDPAVCCLIDSSSWCSGLHWSNSEL